MRTRRGIAAHPINGGRYLPVPTSLPNRARIESALLSRSASDTLAFVDLDRRWSWSAFVGDALELAARLEDAGVRPGERIATYIDQSAEWALSFYAIWLVGGIAVPIHPGLRNAQVEHILDDSGATLLLTTVRRRSTLSIELPATLLVEEAAVVVRKFEPLLLPGGDQAAAILYTSGSTGRPKGILISHSNLIAGARIVSRYLALSPSDRLLGVLPFSFDYGLNQLLGATANGAALILQRSHLPADICRMLEAECVTVMAAVPPLWIQMMGRFSPFMRMQFPALRAITNTGGVFPVELTSAVSKQQPDLEVFLMYGLSEAFRSSYLKPLLANEKSSSIGQAIPETELFVLDVNGRECAEGEVGELVHAGPTVAQGYWNSPEATDAVFRPHPFDPEERAVWSGDLVKKDADGDLYFVGRNDQMIKTRGFRVSPDEVEELIRESGIVAEVAVQGVPDADIGARLVAHVVAIDEATFDVNELLCFCQESMPRYMVPSQVDVRDALPLTSSGKIDRKRLAS